MPVQIISTGQTKPDEGIITIADLATMRSDFKTQVGLTAIPPRYAIQKRHSFYFTREQLLALLNHYPNANAIEFAIGVHKQDTAIECSDQITYDHSNCLGAIVCMANNNVVLKTVTPIDGPDEYILISAFKSVNAFSEVPPCCPGSAPPPYN